MADDPVEAADAAHYVSTYCIHSRHHDCRLTCKTCGAPCRCSCHQSECECGEPLDVSGRCPYDEDD